MRKKRDLWQLILGLAFFLTALPAAAQKYLFSGTVVDEAGQSLPGVAIKVMGTKTGTITDADGHFTVRSDENTPMFQLSYLGMKNLQYKGSAKPMKITMVSDAYTMQETVVTGYQKLKRENATGAFQAITAKDLDTRYMPDLAANLEGKVAGLVKYGSDLTIRGTGTLNADSSPLVVVDGLPISGTLADVNPYDVEKITTLKDAAAAAIYGARASNGVIVIVTKRATKEKLDIELNTDLTFYDKNHYSDYGYASTADHLKVEQDNFDWITNHPEAYNYLSGQYRHRGKLLSPITQLMMRHHLGQVSDADYNSTIAAWSRNNYRKEWQDQMEHNRFMQQYNLALRTKGRYLNSNIVVNWQGDNTSEVEQYSNRLSLQYNGDLNVTRWLNLNFGITLNNTRDKKHASGHYDLNDLTSFADYQSMYNADGSPATLKGYVALDEPSLQNSSFGLKDEGVVPVDELHKSFEKTRETYSRSFVHLNVSLLPELRLSAMFQYEDISDRGETYLTPDSYGIRHIYNLFTSGGVHYMPEGGQLNVTSGEQNYFTFRTQAAYDKTFAGKHELNAVAGYEYRQTYSRNTQNRLYGYDEQTLTSATGLINFKDLINLQTTDLGTNYTPQDVFSSSDVADIGCVRHRYLSYYATADYTYDHRYSMSASYRVDKADLFGADPKFRSCPLWSAGLGWNMQNETFMKEFKWIDLLKVRASYGVTGNINSKYSSFLTAVIWTSDLYGDKVADLNAPPNDQLRWEKTATVDAGVDFALFDHRLTGSVDFYNKKSTDVLSSIDVNPTIGWTTLNTNNAGVSNKGIELQLSGDILRSRTEDGFGISADFTLAYNKNKITALYHEATSGVKALDSYHKGDPVNALYSFRFDHIGTDEDGYQQVYWKKADGTTNCNSLYNDAFTVADVELNGTLDPKWSGSFTPTLTYKRFSLGGMFVFYAGNKFRADAQDWDISDGLSYGSYIPKSFLKYWNASEEDRKKLLGNGYMMSRMNMYTSDLYYCDQDVASADFLKLRSLVLGYHLSDKACHALGISALRIRLQMENVFTCVRNKYGIDPERVNAKTGELQLRAPKSCTLSLNINF